LKRLLQRDLVSSEFAVVETLKEPIFLGTVSRYELEEIAASDALFRTGALSSCAITEPVTEEETERKFVQTENKRNTTQKKEQNERKEIHVEKPVDVDLVSLFVDLDFTTCIKVDAALSECVLKFAVAHAQSLFLLRRGRVVGTLHLKDLEQVNL